MFKILIFFSLSFTAISTDLKDWKTTSDSNSNTLKFFACKDNGLD